MVNRGYDEETQLVLDSTSAFMDESIRKGFIKKVYAIVIAMLALTFSVTIAFTSVPEIRKWGQTRFAFVLLIIVWVTILVLIIVLACSESVRRSYPHNIILLIVFTLLFSVACGITASYTKPFIVLMAIALTLLITIVLTMFAFQTKYDFTIFSGILVCFTIGLLVFGVMILIFQSKILHIVYATVGAILISCYIVVDTQMLMSGMSTWVFI